MEIQEKTKSNLSEQLNNLENLFVYDSDVLKATTKKQYFEMAKDFWDTFGSTFSKLADISVSVPDTIKITTDHIIMLAENHLPKTIFKYKRNTQNMDDALFMVTFILPSLSSYAKEGNLAPEKEEKVIQLSNMLSNSWAEKFGGKPLGIASVQEIADGYETHILKKPFGKFRNN